MTVAMQVDVVFLGSIASNFIDVAKSVGGGAGDCLKKDFGAAILLVVLRYSSQSKGAFSSTGFA